MSPRPSPEPLRALRPATPGVHPGQAEGQASPRVHGRRQPGPPAVEGHRLVRSQHSPCRSRRPVPPGCRARRRALPRPTPGRPPARERGPPRPVSRIGAPEAVGAGRRRRLPHDQGRQGRGRASSVQDHHVAEGAACRRRSRRGRSRRRWPPGRRRRRGRPRTRGGDAPRGGPSPSTRGAHLAAGEIEDVDAHLVRLGQAVDDDDAALSAGRGEGTRGGIGLGAPGVDQPRPRRSSCRSRWPARAPGSSGPSSSGRRRGSGPGRCRRRPTGPSLPSGRENLSTPMKGGPQEIQVQDSPPREPRPSSRHGPGSGAVPRRYLPRPSRRRRRSPSRRWGRRRSRWRRRPQVRLMARTCPTGLDR